MCLHPAAVEALDKHPEVAARVVNLLGLLVAAGEEGLVKANGARGVGPLKLLEVRDEVPAGLVLNELPRPEGGFDRSPSGSCRGRVRFVIVRFQAPLPFARDAVCPRDR
jgi:hypothetical protein